MTPAARTAIHALVARLADGDRTAIAPAFDALWPVMRGFATAALRDASLGEDAAQQALIKLFAQAARFDPTRDAVAWALTITAFEVRTLRKRAQRRREQPLVATADEVGPDRASPPTPESLLVARDLQRAARDALAGLADPDIATIVTALDDDRPAGDPTFRKRVQRALGRLREAWRTKHDTP